MVDPVDSWNFVPVPWLEDTEVVTMFDALWISPETIVPRTGATNVLLNSVWALLTPTNVSPEPAVSGMFHVWLLV